MSISKDLLLKHGGHPPTMFVDFVSERRGKQIFLSDFPDSRADFHEGMYLLGREASEQLPEESIASLCFVCECDAVQHNLETKDTTEREVLLFQMLEILPPKQGRTKQSLQLTLHFVELIRDGAGNLIDLLPDDEPKSAPALEAVLPPTAFLSGWDAARMPKEALRGIIAKARKRNRKHRIAESWEGK
jgi:hypothetical protein